MNGIVHFPLLYTYFTLVSIYFSNKGVNTLVSSISSVRTPKRLVTLILIFFRIWFPNLNNLYTAKVEGYTFDILLGIY